MIAELTIDLGAICRNIARLQATIRPAGFAAVVKGNAYGHGLIPVANAIDDLVDLFCVYRADEALALRAAGVDREILVLGPVEARELPELVRARASVTLWSDGAFRRDLARAARAEATQPLVHLKIDTGVARLGIPWHDAVPRVAAAAVDRDLEVRGIYTHLAAAEELASAFTAVQLERFEAATIGAPAAWPRHAAASAAAILYPQARRDLVRAGIATYGIWPSAATRLAASGAPQLEPALRWATQLVVVREVRARESVGYGCSYVCARDSRIGVLPIGYAEGLPRALGNAGRALVRGRHVPFVGRVCMNMAFLDVTDVPGAAPRDVVTLIGRDGEVSLGADEAATSAATIAYELVTRLPSEVPRRYIGAQPAIAAARSSVPS